VTTTQKKKKKKSKKTNGKFLSPSFAKRLQERTFSSLFSSPFFYLFFVGRLCVVKKGLVSSVFFYFKNVFSFERRKKLF